MTPIELAEKKRELDNYVARVEATTNRRAFRPENYEWESNHIESALAALHGAMCIYNVWQLADDTVLVTYRADGPGPAASIEWVWRNGPIEGYLPALAMIIREITIDSGGSQATLDSFAFTLAQGA